MTALAEFVMRGRFQALLVAVAGSGSLLFCWISAAVVALVTLRKGAGEGAWLLMWALLPAGVLAISFGDSGPAVLLLGAAALALVLRGTVSLALTVLASVAVGVVTALSMLAFGDAFGAIAPPEVALHFRWPSTLLVNGGIAGAARIALGPENAEGSQQDAGNPKMLPKPLVPIPECPLDFSIRVERVHGEAGQFPRFGDGDHLARDEASGGIPRERDLLVDVEDDGDGGVRHDSAQPQAAPDAGPEL